MWKVSSRRSFRLSEKALANLDQYAKQIKNNRNFSLNQILENLGTPQKQSEHPEGENPPPQKEKPFDYENWYPDCEFGTYFKAKKKVHCRCSYPSVKKWLPKDRLVDPQVCENCLPTIQRIKDFIDQRQEEKKTPNHTRKYFTDEKGQRIPY